MNSGEEQLSLEERIQVLVTKITLDQSDVQTRLDLIDAYMSCTTPELKKSLQLCKDVLQHDKNNLVALFRLENILFYPQTLKKHNACVAKIYQVGGRDPGVLNELGVRFEQRGFADIGIFFYQKALERDPVHYPAIHNLSKYYFSQKKFQQANDLLRSAYLRRLQMTGRHHLGFLQDLLPVCNMIGDTHAALHYVSILLEYCDALPDARQTYEAIPDMSGQKNWFLHEKAISLSRLGFYKESAQLLLHLLEEQEGDQEMTETILSNLSVIYSHMGDNKRLREYAEKALQINPQLPEPYDHLGLMHERLGNYDIAEEYYRKALLCSPDHADSLNGLGNIFRYRGNFEPAEKMYQKALQSLPHSRNGNVGMVYVSLWKNDHLSALDYLIAALKSNFSTPVPQDILPKIITAFNGVGGLISYLEGRLTEEPSNFSLLFHLITLYDYSGKDIREAALESRLLSLLAKDTNLEKHLQPLEDKHPVSLLCLSPLSEYLFVLKAARAESPASTALIHQEMQLKYIHDSYKEYYEQNISPLPEQPFMKTCAPLATFRHNDVIYLVMKRTKEESVHEFIQSRLQFPFDYALSEDEKKVSKHMQNRHWTISNKQTILVSKFLLTLNELVKFQHVLRIDRLPLYALENIPAVSYVEEVERRLLNRLGCNRHEKAVLELVEDLEDLLDPHKVICHYDIHAGNYMTDGTLIDPKLHIGTMTHDLSALTVDHRIAMVIPFADYLRDQAFLEMREYRPGLERERFLHDFHTTRFLNALLNLGSVSIKPDEFSKNDLLFYLEEARKEVRHLERQGHHQLDEQLRKYFMALEPDKDSIKAIQEYYFSS
ncbi:MAG: tetratricopeptide repeat protein [Nanoarchaeota archaeon]